MEKQILICTNRRLTERKPSCGRLGAELVGELERLISERGLGIQVNHVACLGRCSEGPNLRLAPGGKFYSQVTTTQLPTILREAVLFFDAPRT